MKKNYFTFNCIAIGIFVLVVLLNLFISNGEYSEQENRYLQGTPELSFESVANREFMEAAEDYSNDQLMFRDFFVRTKAFCERLLGKRENNGVCFADDGYLIEKAQSSSDDIVSKNIEAIKVFSELNRYDVSVCIIPQAFEILKHKLPKGVYAPTVRELEETVYTGLATADVSILDPSDILEKNKDEYIFYRTDHHQTSEGSYLVYRELGKVLGYTPLEKSAFEIEDVSENFLGTTYSKALVFTTPDVISVYKTEINDGASVEFVGEEKESSSIFFPEHLEKKDKYSYFLDGNHGVTVVRGGKQDGGSIALFKDSFSHSLAPFLINHFESIHLIDMRYFQDDPIQYLGENNIKNVLFLYGTATFMTDTTIATVGEYALNSPFARVGLVPECKPVGDSYFDDAVFLGDSLSVGFQSYSGIEDATFLCRTSMSIGGVFNDESDGTSLVEKTKAANPKKIYVMLGVNEYLVPGNIENVMGKFERLIDRLKEDNPQAIIYMQSILPYSKAKEEKGKIKNDVIYDYNEALLKLTEEKQVHFIDVFRAVTEDDGCLRSDLTSDGVHMGTEGCILWADYLRTHAITGTEDAGDDAEDAKKEEPEIRGGEFDLEDICEKIEDVVTFEGEVGSTSSKNLLSTHEIDADIIAGALGLVGGGATAEEISLFEVKEEKYAKIVEESLRKYIKTRTKSFESYIPGEVPKLKNAIIYRNGKVVALVIAKDTGTAKKILEQETK